MHKVAKVVLIIGVVVLMLGAAAAAWSVNQIRDFRYDPSEHVIFEGGNGSFDINQRNGYFVTVWVKGDLECPEHADNRTTEEEGNQSSSTMNSSTNISSTTGFELTIRDSKGKTVNHLYEDVGGDGSSIEYFLNFCDPADDELDSGLDELRSYIDGDYSLAGIVMVQHPVTGMPIKGTYFLESSEEVLITDSASGMEELGTTLAWGFGGATGSCCGFCLLFIGLIMALSMKSEEEQPVIIMQSTSAQPMQVGSMTSEVPSVTVVDDGV